MTRNEERNRASEEYRKFRESCGIKDPIMLDEIEVAHYKGSEWAFEYMERNRLTACDHMTDEEAEREQRFAINFLKENDRTPTFSDAIEITRKETIDKACKAFCEVCKMPNCNSKDCSYLKDFRNHMEGE